LERLSAGQVPLPTDEMESGRDEHHRSGHLLFVGVCVAGIAYLLVVEPIRQRLHDRDKKKKPKH